MGNSYTVTEAGRVCVGSSEPEINVKLEPDVELDSSFAYEVELASDFEAENPPWP